MTPLEHYHAGERLMAMCVDAEGNPPAQFAAELTHYIELAKAHFAAAQMLVAAAQLVEYKQYLRAEAAR